MCVVPDFHQHEAAGRYQGSGLLAIEGCQNTGDLPGQHTACADLNQRTDQNADHVVEKTLSTKVEDNILSFTGDRNVIYTPDGGFLAVFQITEGLKIIFAHKMGSRCLHGMGIQMVGTVPAPAPAENIGDLSLMNTVPIVLTFGIETGMEPGLSLGQLNNGNVLRQISVDIRHNLIR